MKRLINLHPNPRLRMLLGVLPFLLVVVAYWLASEARLAENPNDKLLPSPATLAESIQRLAFEPNVRTGELVLWADTAASLRRLALGVGISASIALLIGMLNGMLPYARAQLSAFVAVVAMVPPMAILPILFIVFGLDELSKVMLIVVGTLPIMARDMEQRTLEIPREQLIKAQTLGASTWQIALRVVLPQVVPRLFQSLRLVLGTAWLFLISAEAIAATEGLGYRIFLVRRYLAMDVILPYVAWITLLAFSMDYGLKRLSAYWFPWLATQDDAGGRR